MILARLAFSSPLLTALQVSGHWDLETLLKSKAPSVEPHGVIAGLTASFLRQLDITELLVNQGEILVSRGGAPTPYRDLTLKARLAVSHPGKADQEIRVNQAEVQITAPTGQLQFSTSMAYGAGVAKINKFELNLEGKTILSLKGGSLPTGQRAYLQSRRPTRAFAGRYDPGIVGQVAGGLGRGRQV